MKRFQPTCRLIMTMAALFLVTTSIWAQGPPQGGPSGQPLKAQKPWWQTSAASNDPILPQWLYHLDGTLSYMNSSGNTSGTSLSSSAAIDIRKNRFTAHSFGNVTRQDVTYFFSQSTIHFTEKTLREQLDSDVTPRIKLVGGVEDYSNTMMFMNKRLNVYAGGGDTITEGEKHQLTLMAGIGHSDFSFDRAAMIRINPLQVPFINTSPSGGGALAQQTLRWAVLPQLSINEDSSYMQYFDTTLGHRWTINTSGNVPINKIFSFTVSLRVKEETNTIIRTLHVFPQDRQVLFGIRVSK